MLLEAPARLHPGERAGHTRYHAVARGRVCRGGSARAIIRRLKGTTLIYNTLEPLLALARPGASIVLVGPTASMLPDAFFRRGVTTLAGDVVTNPDALLDTIAEGGSGYHFFGKSAEKATFRRPETP